MSEAGFNPMSIKRLGGRTCHPRVSSSPSKIPYGGFSPVRLQTGEQPRRPSPTTRALSARPASAPGSPTYTPSPTLHRTPVAQRGNNIGALSQGAPVQRPLARQRVMLSRRVLAYYGLMGASQSRPPIYVLDDGPSPYGLVWAGSERVPHLLCLSVSSVPPSVPRRTRRLQLAVASPPSLAFTSSAQARHPQTHAGRFSRGQRNEAAKFTFCYGPVELLALHRQGRLHSSFHLPSHLHRDVEYHYAGKQPIPATGLSPARQAALWAAGRCPPDRLRSSGTLWTARGRVERTPTPFRQGCSPRARPPKRAH